MTPQSARDWATLVPIVLGALLLIFSAVFYAFTLHTDPLLVTSGGTLIGMGLGGQALGSLRSAAPPDPGPSAETAAPERGEAS